MGLENYIWFFGDPGTLEALRNSVLWVVFMTAGVVGLGLLIAILVDRVRYEPIAKTAIFVPLAISFVAAAIIWKFMYQYRPPGAPQTGTVNAVVGLFGLGPSTGSARRSLLISNFSLIFIGVWIWTGFAMVILSAGLKGISVELLEAARVDGANEWQVFRRIILPLLMPTIFVVGTTIVITALKSFDIVFTLTNGAFGTDVIARKMYAEMFTFSDFGRASAVAIVLLLAIVPFMASTSDASAAGGDPMTLPVPTPGTRGSGRADRRLLELCRARGQAPPAGPAVPAPRGGHRAGDRLADPDARAAHQLVPARPPRSRAPAGGRRSCHRGTSRWTTTPTSSSRTTSATRSSTACSSRSPRR